MSLAPLSIATKGYVCGGAPRDISIATKGYVCIAAIIIPPGPPGSPWKTREELRRRILEEDRWIFAMLVGWLQIKDD